MAYCWSGLFIVEEVASVLTALLLIVLPNAKIRTTSIITRSP